MTLRRLLALSVLLISAIAFTPRAATLTAAPWPSAATTAAPEYGPPNGALVIGGGGGLPSAVFDKFVELGGGVDGRFVIVPTSEGNLDNIGGEKKPHVYVESEVISFWLNRGLKHVKMLHTHDPKIADTVEFASVLSDATGVWFNGGRHHHFVDSYAETLTYTAFHKVLERGGVIGGSSAGATIQGEYLVRGDSIDNSGENLSATFTEIADELHLQYLLGFQAAKADGKAHEIDVRVKRSGVVVRARKAYFTGETTAPAAPASGYGAAGRATADSASASASLTVLDDREIADAIANTNRDRSRASCVLEKLAATKDRPSPPPAAVPECFGPGHDTGTTMDMFID